MNVQFLERVQNDSNRARWNISDVTPRDKNLRTNDKAVDAVASSIREFGFRQPIVADKDGAIIVGHTRHKAAQKLALERIPVHESNPEICVTTVICVIPAVLRGTFASPHRAVASSAYRLRHRPPTELHHFATVCIECSVPVTEMTQMTQTLENDK